MSSRTLIMLTILCTTANTIQSGQATIKLKTYKQYLESGTYDHQNWTKFEIKPQSRYYTFKKVFEHFEKHHGKVIVELGTTHSFVNGSHPGCDKDDIRYWHPNTPIDWDWGAGCFTLMAAKCLAHLNPQIHTIDTSAEAIGRCRIMTKGYDSVVHHQMTSERFLQTCTPGIDIIYLDTGYMNPIEPTAQLQLQEAKIIVERNLLSDNGLLLIDDVRNQNVLNDDSGLGKSKYAIPYLLQNGFEIIEDEYQVILRKNRSK